MSTTRKNIFLLLCGLGILFILLPNIASAACVKPLFGFGPEICVDNPLSGLGQVVDVLINIKTLLTLGLPVAIITLVFAFIAIVTAVIGSALGFIIKILIDITLTISVIPGVGAVDVVTKGWTFSRDFVDLLFIVVLAFIGLATILRLQNYQLQKTLPSLIIIALLVNFSGVLVGFVVDVANIITHFFASQLGSVDFAFQSLYNLLKVALSGLMDLLLKLNQDPLSYMTSLVTPAGTALAIALFFIALSLVLFIVLMLFIVRVGILWILTILAPLAFAAYILPSTRKYWTQWWTQLIQWAMVGIPMSFFLWLSGLMIASSNNVASKFAYFVGDSSLSGANPWGNQGIVNLANAFSNFAAPFLALLFLFVGFTLSLQLAPSGARGVINFTKKLPKHITESRLGARMTAGFASKTQSILGGIEPSFKRLESRGGVLGAVGMAARPAGWATRGVNRLVGPKLIEYAASKRKVQLPKNFDQMTEPEHEQYVRAMNFNGKELVQYAAQMQNKKKYKHTSSEFKQGVVEAMKQSAGDRYLQEAVGTLADVTPETVTKQMTMDMAMVSKTTQEEKDVAKEKTEREINAAANEIEVEVGTNENLRREIDDQRGTRTMRETIEDIAAAKIYAQKLKPQDWANVINPKTTASRLAIRDSNPAALQRIQDNFDHETLEDMFKGAGGLDDAADTPEKLNELAAKNPRLVRALFTNPILLGMEWKGRTQMRDEQGQPIQSFVRYWEKTAGIRSDFQEIKNMPTEGLQETKKMVEAAIEQISRDRQQGILLEDQFLARQTEYQRGLKMADNELRRRGTPAGLAAAQQIGQDLTARERQLQERLSQINAMEDTKLRQLQERERELRTLIQQSQGPAASLDSSYQQALPGWQQELGDIPQKEAAIRQRIASERDSLQWQIEEVELGMGAAAMEDLKVPRKPNPLPEIQTDMPAQLKRFIQQGNKLREVIADMSEEMNKSLEGVRNTEAIFSDVIKEMESATKEIERLNDQEQTGPLAPELRAKREELSGQLRELAERRRELGEKIQQQKETAAGAQKAIEERNADLEGIREQMTPSREEYESKKDLRSREEKLKQWRRQNRRKTP